VLLGWARQDIQQFDRLVRRFLDSRPYDVFLHPDAEVGYVVHKVRFLPASDRIRKHACHVISDLRHALDQAAQAAFTALTGREDEAYFVFGNSPKDVEARLLKRGWPPEMVAVFVKFESYSTGNGHPGGDDEFCEFSKMAGASKHVAALSTIPAVTSAVIEGTGDGPVRVPFNHWDPINQELTVGSFPAGSKPNFKAYFSATIVFRDVQMFESEAAGNVLAGFFSMVESTIAILEFETARILRERTSHDSTL
jgi:hypothetical protein